MKKKAITWLILLHQTTMPYSPFIKYVYARYRDGYNLDSTLVGFKALGVLRMSGLVLAENMEN